MNKSTLVVSKPGILLLGLFVTLFSGMSSSAQLATTSDSVFETEVITLLGKKSRSLPEFQLMDHNQQILDNERLKDKWSLMFFGYTNCPDVCPNTLSIMDNIVNEIASKERDAIKVYFVSVDPERDSLESLAKYMSYFNADFTAATADQDKLKVLTSALGISHKIKKKSDTDSAYSVSHSGYVVLIDPAVKYSGLFFSEPGNVQAIARDMTSLVKNNQF